MKEVRYAGIVRNVIVAGAALIAAGCSNNKGYNGDPGARPLPSGQTCDSIKSNLSRLDARGVRSKVEAAQQGRKLSPAAKAEADEYNKLLGDYLGARCHVPPNPH